jgi:hypothetical protein
MCPRLPVAVAVSRMHHLPACPALPSPPLPSALLNLLTVSTLLILLAAVRPRLLVAHESRRCNGSTCPRSSPCRPDALQVPAPIPYSEPAYQHTSFTDASGALLTITSPAIGRRIDKVEISSFSPCSDSCLAISRPMVRWGEAPHLPHSHISRVSILVRDGSRPALAQPQYAFYPDDDDFVLEKQQRS